MTITFFGTNGSIQTAAAGNVSFAVQTAKTLIMTDCSGSPLQSLAKSGLDSAKLDALFLTHAHVDHLYALPSLLHNLWLLKRKRPLPVLAEKSTLETAKKLCAVFGLEQKKGMFTIDWQQLENEALTIGDIIATPFDVRHHVPAKGLVFTAGGKKIACFADTAPFDVYPACVYGADILVHECAGAGEAPEATEKINAGGHCGARQTAEAANKTGAQRLFLCHLPPDKKEVECIRQTVGRLCAIPVSVPPLFTPCEV